MKIIGIGVDVVEISRIEASISKFGDHFLNRVFCDAEMAYCKSTKFPFRHFAARFAAKEAVSKAFGTGIGAQIGWREIEVLRNERGEPSLRLHGGAAQLREERGVQDMFVSLSHSENYSVASVVLAGP